MYLQVDEETYHSQMAKVELLMNQLTTIDVEKGNPGKISKDEMRNGIRTVFPSVDDEAINAMVKGAEVELDAKETDEIDYKELFKEVRKIVTLTLSLPIFWQFCSLSATFISTARGIMESQACKFSKILFFSTFSFNYV